MRGDERIAPQSAHWRRRPGRPLSWTGWAGACRVLRSSALRLCYPLSPQRERGHPLLLHWNPQAYPTCERLRTDPHTHRDPSPPTCPPTPRPALAGPLVSPGSGSDTAGPEAVRRFLEGQRVSRRPR